MILVLCEEVLCGVVYHHVLSASHLYNLVVHIES